MKIYIGSDHAGYSLKHIIFNYLINNTKYEINDCGAFNYDSEDNYPEFCITTAIKTVTNPGSLGIVLGGSGNGEQIAVNKVLGARCALVWNIETAFLARKHNNANLISIGGRMHCPDEVLNIVQTFLSAKWLEISRHQRRIDAISLYEKNQILSFKKFS